VKPSIYDRIETVQDVVGDFSGQLIPAGTHGTVVEIYSDPVEGYAVDLAIPAPELIGDYRYENVVLRPDQFRVVERHAQDG
jgi:hypothetical protein